MLKRFRADVLLISAIIDSFEISLISAHYRLNDAKNRMFSAKCITRRAILMEERSRSDHARIGEIVGLRQ